jgi:ketosteroid isomerase-like protein
MTPNEALVRRYFAEVVDGRSDATLETLFTPDCQILRADRKLPIIGIAKVRSFVRASVVAVPEIRTKFLNVIDNGTDQIVVHVAHEAQFGPVVVTPVGVVFPRGKKAQWEAFASFSFRDGLISQERVIRDEVAILRCLGLIGARRLSWWRKMISRRRPRGFTS